MEILELTMISLHAILLQILELDIYFPHKAYQVTISTLFTKKYIA